MQDSVIRSFAGKLINQNDKSSGANDYPGRYLNHILSHLGYYSSIYKYIIDIARRFSQKPVEELTVLDFGAGNGLLGMFAKHYGFKKVWINDVDEDFLNASKRLAQNTNIRIEGFIKGNEKDILNYFESINSAPDVILGTDVIEHIYDLESFFSAIKKINPDIVHVFTTASNPYNYWKVKKLRKLQYQDEFVGYPESSVDYSFHYTGPALSFFEQRKKIIAGSFSQLNQDEITELAKRTRGQNKNDILNSVGKYVLTGEMPVGYSDPYWICDPETGSWTERVLPITTYQKIYKENEFSLKVFNGYYNSFDDKNLKSLAARIINTAIGFNHYIGRYFSPFIVLAGKKIK